MKHVRGLGTDACPPAALRALIPLQCVCTSTLLCRAAHCRGWALSFCIFEGLRVLCMTCCGVKAQARGRDGQQRKTRAQLRAIACATFAQKHQSGSTQGDNTMRLWTASC